MAKTDNVNLRDIWPHEALDFTPWLAENLDLLGDALGLKLELVQTEAPVGGPPYSCDILARETNKDVLVAIENQLEWTDFSHLAQTLIYTAGLKANIAIWVASEFRYESAEVLNWLNEWMSRKVAFYGVKVEVVKTGESTNEKRFRKVVWPGGWSKDDTLPLVPPPDPIRQQFLDFFRQLTQEMLDRPFADKSTQYFDYTGRFFPSSFNPDVGYAVSLWKTAWVSLYVRTWDSVERNNRIFDELQGSKAQIEGCRSIKLEWQKYQAYSFFTVSFRKDGVNLAEGGIIDDPPEKLEEIRAWMIDHLPKLKEIFDSRIEKLLEEFPAEKTEGQGA